MRVVLICTVFSPMVLSLPAMAQSYCVGGSLVAQETQMPTDGAKALRTRCQSGDIVYFPHNSTALIGLVCDFTKSIVVSGGNVICAVAAPRELVGR